VAEAKATRRLGQRGEKLARKYLQKKGYRYLKSNFMTNRGEVDLIMQDGETIVFVEVKCRKEDHRAGGEMLVNISKRYKMETAARRFVHIHKLHSRPLRFDVIAMVTDENAKPEIKHHINIFVPGRQKRR